MDRQSLNTPCSKDLFSVFDRRPASVFQITPTESSWKTGVYEGSYRNLFTWLESTRLISEISRSRENNCLENSSMLTISKSSGAPDSTKCWKRLICWTMVRGMLKRRQEGEAIYIQSGTAFPCSYARTVNIIYRNSCMCFTQRNSLFVWAVEGSINMSLTLVSDCTVCTVMHLQERAIYVTVTIWKSDLWDIQSYSFLDVMIIIPVFVD